MMEYHFKIHKEKKGYWADCLELEGCVTQAGTFDELMFNMKEALDLYLEEPEDSPRDFPLPKKHKENKSVVKVAVDDKVAFAFLLKKARLEKGMTQSEMAKLLEYKSVFAYQKLESPKYANPTYLKLKKLKSLLPNFKLNLLF